MTEDAWILFTLTLNCIILFSRVMPWRCTVVVVVVVVVFGQFGLSCDCDRINGARLVRVWKDEKKVMKKQKGRRSSVGGYV